MKRILFVMAALTVATSAYAAPASNYADPNGPIRQGTKCWAISDARGFGYWDTCASREVMQETAKLKGITTLLDEATTQGNRGSGEGGGSGGSGGSGGGGNSR
jgi:hypothetical protein